LFCGASNNIYYFGRVISSLLTLIILSGHSSLSYLSTSSFEYHEGLTISDLKIKSVIKELNNSTANWDLYKDNNHKITLES